MYGQLDGNTVSDSFLFSYYMIALLRFFQNRSFVLSREHENQNVATIGTVLDQFMLSCKEKRLLAFTVSTTYFIEIRREA